MVEPVARSQSRPSPVAFLMRWNTHTSTNCPTKKAVTDPNMIQSP